MPTDSSAGAFVGPRVDLGGTGEVLRTAKKAHVRSAADISRALVCELAHLPNSRGASSAVGLMQCLPRESQTTPVPLKRELAEQLYNDVVFGGGSAERLRLPWPWL